MQETTINWEYNNYTATWLQGVGYTDTPNYSYLNKEVQFCVGDALPSSIGTWSALGPGIAAFFAASSVYTPPFQFDMARLNYYLTAKPEIVLNDLEGNNRDNYKTFVQIELFAMFITFFAAAPVSKGVVSVQTVPLLWFFYIQ